MSAAGRKSKSSRNRLAIFASGRTPVSNVSNGGSDMPDAGVVQCVVRAYYGLSFPQPEGGMAHSIEEALTKDVHGAQVLIHVEPEEEAKATGVPVV